MKSPIFPDISLRKLISKNRLKAKIDELGKTITDTYKNKSPILISVSNGAIIFTADLMRAISLPVRLDSVKAHSYSGMKSSGDIDFNLSLKFSTENQDIIIVDDILDSGLTLKTLSHQFEQMNPASLKTCVLLDKPDARKAPFSADFVGFTIPNAFVVGYGLDYNELYRNLPYIAELKRVTAP